MCNARSQGGSRASRSTSSAGHVQRGIIRCREMTRASCGRFEPIRSTIDRTSLREIARAGGGEYFELGTSADEQLAARIIQNAARRSGNEQVDQSFDELYWYLLVAAAACLGLGSLFVKQRAQLGLGIVAALALFALISSLRS